MGTKSKSEVVGQTHYRLATIAAVGPFCLVGIAEYSYITPLMAFIPQQYLLALWMLASSKEIPFFYLSLAIRSYHLVLVAANSSGHWLYSFGDFWGLPDQELVGRQSTPATGYFHLITNGFQEHVYPSKQNTQIFGQCHSTYCCASEMIAI